MKDYIFVAINNSHMKALVIIALILCTSLFSCKKEQKPTLYGSWVSINQSWQFTINSLSVRGHNTFRIEGQMQDVLVWTFNGEETIFKIVKVNPESMALEYDGKPVYFKRAH